MKTIYVFLAIVSLIVVGCRKEVIEPTADFYVSNSTVEIFEDVVFYNRSTHANKYQWDFGDGTVANSNSPSHQYLNSGNYTVKLSAYNGNLVDYSYYSINVLVPTVLNVEVREYFSNYLVPNASILIYPSDNDWINQTNKITEIFTDNNGIAEIEGLPPGIYYLDVWEKYHNNVRLGSEDVGFIKTPLLIRGYTTLFTALVDYYPPQSASRLTSKRNIVLLKSEKRVAPNDLNKRNAK